MAIGKNKRVPRKKGKGKKKIVDSYVKKEWFTVRAPNMFAARDVGYTPANKTIGQRLVRDNVMGRVFETSLGDLIPNSENVAFRKFKLKVGEVDGQNLLTYFWGMGLTTDQLRSLVRKWTTLIEAQTDVKTTDGTIVRIFCVGITTHPRGRNGDRSACYAQRAQVRKIRKKMIEIMKKEVADCSINQLVEKLIPGSIAKVIEKATQGIYPLTNVYIRKVKTIKAPKVDITRLLDSHKGKATGKKVARPAEEEEDSKEGEDAAEEETNE